MHLPEPLNATLEPLFKALPPEKSMATLCPQSDAGPALRTLVESILKQPLLATRPALQAGLWLYVDELDRSHSLSQDLKNSTGSYWHGIMHRREGDFSNSHYWFHRTGKHPAMAQLRGYDGHGLVNAAEAAYPGNPEEVVRRQREEWMNLFTWCASAPG